MKKIIIGIISVIAVILIIFGLRSINNYYGDTYKGETAYAKISNITPKKEPGRDNHGKLIDGVHQYNYNFDFVTKDGNHKKMSYLLSGEKVKPFKNNRYIKVIISKSRVLEGPNYVTKNEIPKKAFAKLK